MEDVIPPIPPKTPSSTVESAGGRSPAFSTMAMRWSVVVFLGVPPISSPCRAQGSRAHGGGSLCT